MEMHLALIVDGYKFVETGFNFNQLPNSIAQLALPEWALDSQPASPVSLVTGRDTLGVEYSDGSVKTVGVNQAGEIVSIYQDDTTIYASSEGCDSGISLTEGSSLGDDHALATVSFGACSVSGNTMNANVAITIDGVTFVSELLDWGGDPGQWSTELDTTAFEIQS